MYKYFFLILSIFIFFELEKVSAIDLLENVKIYNIEVSKDIIVYEYEEISDDISYHSIGIYFIGDNIFKVIKNNNGDDINSSLYFPSVSSNGKYITFTSRATNITDDENYYCYNVLENNYEYCSRIYVYDVYSEELHVIKNNQEYFNGDCYISKISGNGKYVVFESTATNNLNFGTIDKCVFNDENICINIFKYDLVLGNVILVSTSSENYGGDFSSISPSISYDGRYITFQSASSNITKEKYDYSLCKNISDTGDNICTQIFLYDSKQRKNIIITANGKKIFNDNSGNPIISEDASVVAYETYSTNIFDEVNGRMQVLYYDIKSKNNYIVCQNNKLNNRDTNLKSISKDGKYILFETSATNLNNEGLNSLYIYGVDSNNISLLSKVLNDNTFIELNDNNIYYIWNFSVEIAKIDEQPPIIEKNQVIYVIKDSDIDLREKIIFSDNLSSNDTIKIFFENNLIFNSVGEFHVEVFCIDEFENVGSEYVNIVVIEKDVDSPVFVGYKEIRVLKGSNSLNLSSYIRAEDKIDGFTRIYIIDDGNLDLNKSGKYKLSLMSKDNSNNKSYYSVYIIVYENYNFDFYYEIIFIIVVFLIAIFSIIKVKH